MTGERGQLIVVGGGPVGLAAAIEARLAGLPVTLVEPRRGPVDKACGEGLMPGTVAALHRLGADVEGRPFRGIRYVAPDGRTTASHAFRAGSGLGVRRTALHAALSRRATEVGVAQVTGRTVAVTQRGDDHDGTDAVEITLEDGSRIGGDWLFGCDGLHSSVRRLTGLQLGSDGRRFGIRRHAALSPWSDHVEVHWSARGEAYVTPIARNEVGVAVLGPRGWSFDEALETFPRLTGRLRGVPWTTTARGAGPLRQRVTSPRSGRVLLVGDAAGYVDALTGEGLRIGLACAQAAVQSAVDGRPEDYPRRWRRLTREYRWLTSSLVTATRIPLVRRKLVPAAAALPLAFGAAVDALAR